MVRTASHPEIYRARLTLPAVALCAAFAVTCCSGPPNEGDAPVRAVVLIVVDALRADHLGAYGYEAHPTSPNLDRRSASGRVFERAWATSSWTLPSFGSILTGYLPAAHAAGVEVDDSSEATTEVVAARRFVTLPEAVPTVAERLAAAGFATGAFVANPFLDPRFGLGRGFAYYDHYDTSNADTRRAGEVVDLALQWIDGNVSGGTPGDISGEVSGEPSDDTGRPFFLMVHLFDPHLDYDAPEPFRGRFTNAARAEAARRDAGGRDAGGRDAGGRDAGGRDAGGRDARGRGARERGAESAAAGEGAEPTGGYLELPVRGLWPIRNRVGDLDAAERDFIVAAYDEEVAYVDAEVDRFLAGLQERGLYDESLIVLTSDHGEELFEHGGFEHGHSMYEEVLRVPLIVWGPQVAVGRDATPVSLIDLAPTMLAAAGASFDDLPGRSLLDGGGAGEDERRRPIIAERLLYGEETKAIVRWPQKAILRVAAGEAMLFDLAADPGEQHDLAAERPDELAALLGELAERLAAAESLGVGVEAELDEDLLRRLRALGYIR